MTGPARTVPAAARAALPLHMLTAVRGLPGSGHVALAERLAVQGDAVVIRISDTGSVRRLEQAIAVGSVVLVSTVRDPRLLMAFHGAAFSVVNKYSATRPFRLSLLTIDHFDGGLSDAALAAASGTEEADIAALRSAWIHESGTDARGRDRA